MSTAAVNSFMQLGEDEQRAALAGMSPDAKQRLLAAIRGQPLPPTGISTMGRPEARASLVQSMAMQAQPKVPQPPMQTSALGRAYGEQAAAIGGIGDVAKNLVGGTAAAFAPVANPAGAFAQQAGDIAQSPAGALGINKPAIEQAAQAQDYPELARQITSPIATVLTGALIGRGMPKGAPATETRISKLSYATGAHGTAVNFPEAIRTALPDLDAAAAGKPPATVGDLHQTVRTALRNTENEYNLALQPIASQEIVPMAIADQIRAQLKSSKTVADQRMAKLLNARAVEFEKPWTYGELNQERMNANARLKGFENAGPTQQMATMRMKTDVMADKAIADATREVVYDALQRTHGRDFAALKARQSALLNLTDALSDRINELANKTAMQKGMPVLSGENISIYGRPESGHIGTSIHRLQHPFTKNIITPESGASSAVRAAFPPVSPNVYGMPITVLLPKGAKQSEPPVPPNAVVPPNPPPIR